MSAIVLAVWSAYRVKTGRMLREQRATAEFSRRLINSQEAERKRVAGELHDGVGQYFLVILSRAKMALREVGQGTAAGDLEEIVSTAGQGIEDVRKVAFGLSPYDIEQFGLPSSIETMLKRLTPGTGLRWDARLEALRRQIPRGMSIHIYRTIQECATNVVKHAEATEMTIDAAVDGEMITLTIRDNGRGFQGGISQAGAVYRQGFGLAGLRERLRLLGGSLRIDSPDGGGTAVVVAIPLRGANSDENHQPKGGG